MSFAELKRNLEFDKILEHISLRCVSDLGKIRLLNSEPLNSSTELSDELQKVTETRNVFISESGMPVWTFEDVRPYLSKIEPLESYLDPGECQLVNNILEISAEVSKFFSKQGEKYPNLIRMITGLDPLENLNKLIISTVEPGGEIYDNASPELKRIRNEITRISKQINIKLDRILEKQSEYLQENYVTLREGRLVLPVREFSVKKVPGIVHGQSATGQTHYIEPFSVVALNNEMHELYMQEKREIILILKRLSANIRQHSAQIHLNQNILVTLDVLQAKAQYANSINAVAPEINSEFSWQFENGYHPLLLKKLAEQAVPLSVTIGEDYRILIVSGPNAGGKTVALKTIGLLQLLFQCGFHIPVKEKAKFPICAEIYTVIGDDQSIEDDLSTFSSHIKKLNDIVAKAKHRSLVLIDEIGTGTDPSEGAALAIAVLEELNRAGLVTLVTTHHGELKVFAHKMPNVQNAAMQFDRDTLAPKFRLEMGMPGSSYAFDISRRLGVNPKLLERAQSILGSSRHDLEEMILELSDVKQEYEDRLSSLSLKKSELAGMHALYRTRSDELQQKKKQFEKDALNQAQDMLNRVNQTIETVIREIRESEANKQVIKNGRARLKELKEEVSGKLSRDEKPAELKPADLREGMPVRNLRFGVRGKVARIYSDKNEVEIETSGMKMIVPVVDLVLEKNIDHQAEKAHTVRESTPSVSNEISVRGMTADEAVMELERYLDIALQSDWHEIRIIHGKGTGILRKRIHEYLKKHKQVSSFRLGSVGEGDTGVTIINL